MSDKGNQVEVAADRIRGELLSTLHELDRRRAQATDLHAQFERHKVGAAIAAGGLALVVGGLVGASILRHRYHDARLRKERVRGFVRAWEHPQRIASQASYRPLPMELLRKFAIVFGTVLVTTYAKRTAQLVVNTQKTGEEQVKTRSY